MPFKSAKQRKFLFATKPGVANKFARDAAIAKPPSPGETSDNLAPAAPQFRAPGQMGTGPDLTGGIWKLLAKKGGM